MIPELYLAAIHLWLQAIILSLQSSARCTPLALAQALGTEPQVGTLGLIPPLPSSARYTSAFFAQVCSTIVLIHVLARCKLRPQAIVVYVCASARFASPLFVPALYKDMKV